MVIRGRVRRGEYFDSVALMLVARAIGQLPGVADAAVIAGSAENKGILRASGLYVPEFDDAAEGDVLVCVKAETDERVEAAMAEVDSRLKASRRSAGGADVERPGSIEGAVRLMPDATLALISVAGRYAAAEARKAIDAGLNVMLFSDNVSIDDEVALKRLARERGLLVMGPDCGTAVINGVPLGFANAIRRGRVGIVGASGTGTQEVCCVVSNLGEGVSQAIGTGGRDVKKDVGGITFVDAMEALVEDSGTSVILLVAKPPHESVMRRIDEVAARAGKPVVGVFLGDSPETRRAMGSVRCADTLDEAARWAVALARDPRALAPANASVAVPAFDAVRRVKGRMARGLFSGGTFCGEAQVVFQRAGFETTSNAPVGKSAKMRDSLVSEGHSFVDFGEDEFTVGRPHPMIDFSLRNRRVVAEANDPEVGLILIDVVLGFGAHMDPAGEIESAVRGAASKVPVVAFVTGTDEDPQGRPAVIKRLREAGAIVFDTCAAASQWSVALMRERGR